MELKPVAGTTASIGLKAVDKAVVQTNRVSWINKLAKPVVTGASKAIQGLSRYALSNTARLLASGLGGKFIKQLPDFKEWRLYSVTSSLTKKK